MGAAKSLLEAAETLDAFVGRFKTNDAPVATAPAPAPKRPLSRVA